MPLGERAGDKSDSRYCGIVTDFNDDIPQLLSLNINGGFDFVVATLVYLISSLLIVSICVCRCWICISMSITLFVMFPRFRLWSFICLRVAECLGGCKFDLFDFLLCLRDVECLGVGILTCLTSFCVGYWNVVLGILAEIGVELDWV